MGNVPGGIDRGTWSIGCTASPRNMSILQGNPGASFGIQAHSTAPATAMYRNAFSTDL
jgi:hypothetical protein